MPPTQPFSPPPKHTFAEKTGHLQKTLAHFPSQILSKARNRRVSPLQPYEKRMIRGILITDHKFYWIKHILSAISVIVSRVFNVGFVYYAVIASVYEVIMLNPQEESVQTGLKESTVKILQYTDTAITTFECIMVSVFALLALMGFAEAFLKRGSTSPYYNWSRFWLNFRRCGFSSFQFSLSANLLFHTMGRMTEFVVQLWIWADHVTKYLWHRKYMGARLTDDAELDVPQIGEALFVTPGASAKKNARNVPLWRGTCQLVLRTILRFVTIVPFVVCSVLLLFLLVVFGTAAVIIKLINLYQEALTSNIGNWGIAQYILILGFLNQLSSASSMGDSDREELLAMTTELDLQNVNVVDQEADEYGPYTGAEYVSDKRDAQLRRMGSRFENIYVYSFLCAMIGFACGGWILVLVAGIAFGFYFMTGFDQGMQVADIVTVSPTIEKITRSLVWRHAIFVTEFLATLYVEVCDTNLLLEMIRLMHIGDASNFAQKLPTHVAMDLIPRHLTLLEVEVYNDYITAMLVERIVCVETGATLMPGKKRKRKHTYARQWDVLLTNPSSRAVLIQGFSLEDVQNCELLMTNPAKSGQAAFHDYIFLPPYTFHQLQASVKPWEQSSTSKLPSSLVIFKSETQDTFAASADENLKLHRWIFSQQLQVLSVENCSKSDKNPHIELFHVRYCTAERLLPNDTVIPPMEDVRKSVGNPHPHHQAMVLITHDKKKPEKKITYRLYFTAIS